MAHKIEISDRTYERLKEYCVLNNLKIGQYADKLLYDSLMIEMYGDVPFTNYRKPVKEMTEIPIKTEKTHENSEKESEKTPEITPEPVKEEIIKPKETPIEETLKESGVPDKVVKKITKRRLK